MKIVRDSIKQFIKIGILSFATAAFEAHGQAPGPAILRIHAGGGATGSWSADEYGSTASTYTTTASIATPLVASPAPQAIYQSERSGVFTYTIPNLTPGVTYPINLHFAEIYFSSVGQREFNVAINGTQVLDNFDIIAAAGGPNVAIVRQFPGTASNLGTISIAFTSGAVNQAKISGIEVLPPLAPEAIVSSGAVYTLVSKQTQQALDDNNTTAPNGAVVQWGLQSGNSNQQWQINATANGHFNLVSLSNGLALDSGGSKTVDAAVVQGIASTNSANQQWTVSLLSNGAYQIVNASNGYALDTESAGGNGGSIMQAPVNGTTSQQWEIVPVQIGAKTPFTSYEAEAGTLGGGATVTSLLAPPTTQFSSPQLEASGHAYVNLAETGQSVTFTNTTGQPVTAINLRYSIPDAPTGGGISSTLNLYVNGSFRQAIPVNSTQTWTYEGTNASGNYDSMNENPNAPNSTMPHRFWDEAHLFITGSPVAEGDTITIQKDGTNSATYYHIDVVDLETPPAQLPQPANSLSILSFGAVANTPSFDNTSALINCISAAQTKNMIVWIPEGTFYLKTETTFRPTGITVQGAGPWYSTLYFNPTTHISDHGSFLVPVSSTIRDLHLDENAYSLADAAYGINIKGDNWLIDNVWIEHFGPSVWADGSNGTVQNSRINNSMADGINLNNGSGASGNSGGTNLTAINNFVRGSGDDGIAINDQPNVGTPSLTPPEMQNTTVLHNTIVAPWWANNIGIYGGNNDLVANNLVMDSVKEFGVSVGIFGTTGHPVQTAHVQGNFIYRGGSFGYGNRYPGIGVGVTATPTEAQGLFIRGNLVSNAMFDGVDFVDGNGGSLISNTVVNAPGLGGFVVNSSARGTGSIVNSTVFNLRLGQQAFPSSSSNFVLSTSNDSSSNTQ